MLHERGVVIEKQYYPDTRQVVSGTGFSTSGHMVITSHTVGEKEKYMVILKCEHNIVFSINNPNVYGKLSKGDNITIDYYEIVNKKGEVVDFDFVDANVYK
jgi:hypothetical protein